MVRSIQDCITLLVFLLVFRKIACFGTITGSRNGPSWPYSGYSTTTPDPHTSPLPVTYFTAPPEVTQFPTMPRTSTDSMVGVTSRKHPTAMDFICKRKSVAIVVDESTGNRYKLPCSIFQRFANPY